jgi:hypothetical protein
MPAFATAKERAMSIETLVQHFGAVEDPHCRGKIEHRLLDILVIAVCAVIACAESWDDIALYGRSKLAWRSPLTRSKTYIAELSARGAGKPRP